MKKKRLEEGELHKIAVLGSLLFICLLATYYSHFILKIEIIFTHLFYVPIILAGLWWSRKGIMVAVFLALLLLVSHALSPLGTFTWTDVARASMFMVVGTVVALLNEKRHILEDKLRAYSKTLEQKVGERTKELRESEERYKGIFETVPASIILSDMHGQIVDINPYPITLIAKGKTPREDFIGKNIVTNPTIVNAGLSETYKRVLEGEPFDQKDMYFPILPTGTDGYFNVKGVPLLKNGEVIGAIIMHEDITERKRMDEQIKASLKEKEELLKEIHHRVKNNLQIISSLLDLSSMRSSNAAVDLFTDARAKIHTMALIHSQLYRSDRFDQIDMENHIRELTDFLSQIYASRLITPVIESSSVYLSITQAIPCALVLNELISNAYKHAFREGQKGTVKISMQRSAEDTIFMRVKDDGIGIPEEVDIYKTESLGLKLVRNLVQKQLKGEIEVKRDNGTEFIIEFKHIRETCLK